MGWNVPLCPLPASSVASICCCIPLIHEQCLSPGPRRHVRAQNAGCLPFERATCGAFAAAGGWPWAMSGRCRCEEGGRCGGGQGVRVRSRARRGGSERCSSGVRVGVGRSGFRGAFSSPAPTAGKPRGRTRTWRGRAPWGSTRAPGKPAPRPGSSASAPTAAS
eukprot:4281336-Prymnesium_polylepis.1